MLSKSHQQHDPITVLNIATNIYLDYWKRLVISADEVTTKNDNVSFWLFTDRVDEARKFAKGIENIQVNIFETPPLGWPDATILRYKILLQHVSGQSNDIFVYLDADMLLENSPWQIIRDQMDSTDICLVEHPGYWRPSGLKRFFMYLNYPQIFLSDVKSLLKFGGLGQWERRKSSTAFVQRRLRKSYYCGGIWFGRPDSIKDLMIQLSKEVEIDRNRGITAVWHDESHLNSWSVNNQHGVESPKLCFDATYPQLKGMTSYIHAVRKNESGRT